jgi:hypothetical protein
VLEETGGLLCDSREAKPDCCGQASNHQGVDNQHGPTARYAGVVAVQIDGMAQEIGNHHTDYEGRDFFPHQVGKPEGYARDKPFQHKQVLFVSPEEL